MIIKVVDAWVLRFVFVFVFVQIVGDSFEFGAAKVTERLKRLVYGSTSDVELSPDLWDFPINSEPWDF